MIVTFIKWYFEEFLPAVWELAKVLAELWWNTTIELFKWYFTEFLPAVWNTFVQTLENLWTTFVDIMIWFFTEFMPEVWNTLRRLIGFPIVLNAWLFSVLNRWFDWSTYFLYHYYDFLDGYYFLNFGFDFLTQGYNDIFVFFALLPIRMVTYPIAGILWVLWEVTNFSANLILVIMQFTLTVIIYVFRFLL